MKIPARPLRRRRPRPASAFPAIRRSRTCSTRCYDGRPAPGRILPPCSTEIRQRYCRYHLRAAAAVSISRRTLPPVEAHLRTSPQTRTICRQPRRISELRACWRPISALPLSTRRRWSCSDADGLLPDAEATNTAIGQRAASSTRPAPSSPASTAPMPDGTIHTFSRGGSDVTGARSWPARWAQSCMRTGRTCPACWRRTRASSRHPHVVDYITYRELRELSYMGASVLHEDAVFPVRLREYPHQHPQYQPRRRTPVPSSCRRSRPTRTSARSPASPGTRASAASSP